jgi:hypothetical protein
MAMPPYDGTDVIGAAVAVVGLPQLGQVCIPASIDAPHCPQNAITTPKIDWTKSIAWCLRQLGLTVSRRETVIIAAPPMWLSRERF